MPRRTPYTLAELVERTALPGMVGIDARRKASRLAMRLGVPVPAACEKRCVAHSRPAVVRVKRPPAPPVAVVVDTVPIAIELPEPLRAWRAARPGACIGVSRRGVTLYEHGREARHFPDAAAAIAALGLAA